METNKPETKNQVYQIVTDRIIAQLEKGEIPWKRPWGNMGLPMNLKTKKPYRGINLLLLSFNNFKSPYWVTYEQAKSFGGYVKSGEKASIVTFWKQLKTKEKNEGGEWKEKVIPLLRYFQVFNVEQTTIPADKIPQKEEGLAFSPVEACEEILKDFEDCPEIEHGKGIAAYSVISDKVFMPHKENFKSVEAYYATLFHELTHSTGHKSRCDRDMSRYHQDKHERSFEELIAEIGASFLCAHAGIDTAEIQENSQSYINGWLEVLKKDPKAIVQASSKAAKGVRHIMNEKIEEIPQE